MSQRVFTKKDRKVVATIYNQKPGKETFGVQVNLWEPNLSKEQLSQKSLTLSHGQYLNVELIGTQIDRVQKSLEAAENSESAAKLQKRLDRLLTAQKNQIFAELTLYTDSAE